MKKHLKFSRGFLRTVLENDRFCTNAHLAGDDDLARRYNDRSLRMLDRLTYKEYRKFAKAYHKARMAGKGGIPKYLYIF